MRWKASIALLLVLAATDLAAQSRGGPSQPRSGSSQSRSSSALAEFPFKWWQEEKFKTELGLSSEQVARIDGIFTSTLPKLRTCYRNLERLENQMNDMISSGEVTEPELIKQIDAVETSRSELSKERTLMLYRMRQVLTPEQRSKMKTMHEEWEKDRRRYSR
ncbi:MAG: Spy/CpxP family protein refolding chaperone [Vicinamibacterales bacterium]